MHDNIRYEIRQKRDCEQHDTDQEQNSIMRTAEYYLAQFRGDGRRDRSGRIEQAPGNDAGVAARHQHDHGLADGPAKAQRNGGKNPRECRRQDDL